MKVFSQAILKGALTPEHLANGLFLDESDDHTIALMVDSKVICRYSSTRVLVQSIREDANLWLTMQK